jgi:hypothetical protein
MCQETIHWRICGHHTFSRQFCQHVEADGVVVPDPSEQQEAKNEDPMIQELRDQLAQNLETIDLSLYFDDDETASSPPTSPPPRSTTSSSSDDYTPPSTTPGSPTYTPDTSDTPKSSPAETAPLASSFFGRVSVHEEYELQPCSVTSILDDYSRYHDLCKHPDGCDYERVNRQWTCCGCGRGPNRGTVCHRTIDDAIGFGHEIGKDECGHFLCASCSPCGKLWPELRNTCSGDGNADIVR